MILSTPALIHEYAVLVGAIAGLVSAILVGLASFLGVIVPLFRKLELIKKDVNSGLTEAKRLSAENATLVAEATATREAMAVSLRTVAAQEKTEGEAVALANEMARVKALMIEEHRATVDALRGEVEALKARLGPGKLPG